jgi:quercetin dioxygenase-like cupin family protein
MIAAAMLLAWAATTGPATTYTLPQDLRWVPLVAKGVPRGAYTAYIRGKPTDTCGQLLRMKFPNGFVYPWHVNNEYDIFTVLQGTLIIGFDKHHAPSAERTLPTGSVIQGLATEPHYGRAIGETIFQVYAPCGVKP